MIRETGTHGRRTKLLLVGGIAMLFAMGFGAGWLVFWGVDDRQSGDAAGEALIGEGLPRQGGDAPGATPGSPPDRAEVPTRAVGGDSPENPAQGSALPTGPSDQDRAAVPPPPGDSPRPPAGPGFLQTGFGTAAAPVSVARAARIGEAIVEGDSMTAEYSWDGTGGFDMLFLSVTRTASPADAATEADMLFHAFPVRQLSYTWGGRSIRQAMNDEGRPDQFPPLICFVWTEGRHAIRVVVAPLAPDRVADARKSALEFIGALPY